MAAVTVAACVAIVWTIWSRRPLAGVIIAVTGLIYHFRIARKPAITKLWYFGGLIASVLVLVLYLEATRGARFYGRAAEAVSSSTFSSENLQSTFAGVEMNYRIYEFVLQHVPREHPYLYGSGYVPAFVWWPRAIWPSKPVSSGFAVTQMWFGKEGELNLPTNFGLPTMGEAYVNFGILGVVVILFLIGRVVRIMNSYLQMHNNNVIAWTAWLMITPDMATEWRGDFTSMTVQALLRVMGFLAVVWIACKLIPSRSVSPLVPAGQKLPWNRVQPMALSSRTSVRRGG